MKSRELELTEDRGEFVSGGEILTDKKAMEKMIDGELLKIANEELLPYKAYLQHSAKIFGPFLLGILAGIGGIISGFYWASETLCAISFVVSVSSFVGGIILCIEDPDCFFGLALCKMYRARKIFKRAMEELRLEAMNGQIELKSLKQKFPEKVKDIVHRKDKEKEKFWALLDKARNSDI